jgi:hypothetical protein
MGWVVSVTPRPRFTPGERTPGTHWTGGWVGPRAGLDTGDRGKILFPCRGSNPDRPVIQLVVRQVNTQIYTTLRSFVCIHLVHYKLTEIVVLSYCLYLNAVYRCSPPQHTNILISSGCNSFTNFVVIDSVIYKVLVILCTRVAQSV